MSTEGKLIETIFQAIMVLLLLFSMMRASSLIKFSDRFSGIIGRFLGYAATSLSISEHHGTICGRTENSGINFFTPANFASASEIATYIRTLKLNI